MTGASKGSEMSGERPVAVQLEELRGRIAGTVRDQEGHEMLCAERYSGIRNDIKSLRSQIGWSAGVAVSIVIALLGWSLKSQWDTNQATLQALLVIRSEGVTSFHPGQPPSRY